MPTDQHVNMDWETPSEAEIPQISKGHVAAMESSDDDAVWQVAGMHHVVITTVGRKSGKEHKVALPFWRDPEGRPVVVASFAGAKQHPSWYLNLSDRNANPELKCRVQGRQFWADAEVLEGDERARIWKLLNEDRAWYDNYQAKTDRQIPLVRLIEKRPVE